MGLMRGIRKNVKVIWWVIIVAVVVTFIFWGTRFGGGRAARYVGKVFGKKVSLKDFRLQWQAAQQRAREIEYMYGQVVSNEVVEDMAWRRVAELREADRWGIVVPMSQVRESIRAMFTREGSFDEAVYRNHLYRRSMTEDEFAAFVRDNIRIGQLERLVAETVVAPPAELREQYNYQKEQRKIKFHPVEAAELEPAFEVTGQGEEYYNSHRDEFRVPRKVAVQYMTVETKEFVEKATVSDDELMKYYEENKSSFAGADGKAPELAEVRPQLERILKNQKAEEMAREKAEKLFTLTDGSAMREVAQKNGLVLQSSGLIPEEGDVNEEVAKEPEFRKAAFSTAVGAASPIIKTSKGYCVLSPVRMVEAQIPPFEEVRKVAAEKQRTQQLKDAAVRAGVLQEEVDRFVKEHSVVPAGIDVTEEEVLSYYDRQKSTEFRKPKKVKAQYLMVEKAPFEKELKITEGQVKKEYEDTKEHYKDEKGNVKPLEQVKEQVEESLRERRTDEMAQERANQVLVVSRPQRMRHQAQRYGLTLRESWLFAQEDKIDDYVGESPIFASRAFGTKLGDVSPIFRTDLGYCILSPIQVVEEAVSDLEEVVDKAAEKTKTKKAKDLASRIAQELYRQVSDRMSKEKKDFETSCKELGLKVEESGYFRRSDSDIQGIGTASGLAFSAFQQEPGKVGYPMETQKGRLFYAVSEVKPPSDEEFGKDKDKEYDTMTTQKGREAFTEWLTALMKEANVQSYLRPAPKETKKEATPGKDSRTTTRTQSRTPPGR